MVAGARKLRGQWIARRQRDSGSDSADRPAQAAGARQRAGQAEQCGAASGRGSGLGSLWSSFYSKCLVLFPQRMIVVDVQT